MNAMKTMLAVLLLGAPAMAHEGHDHGAVKAASGKTTTVKGELLDLACYMAGEEKGAKHAECAGMCVAGGSPLGVLAADGKVYLLVNDHHDEKPYAAAKTLAGMKATVTGRLVTRGGLPAIIVASAEKMP